MIIANYLPPLLYFPLFRMIVSKSQIHASDVGKWALCQKHQTCPLNLPQTSIVFHFLNWTHNHTYPGRESFQYIMILYNDITPWWHHTMMTSHPRRFSSGNHGNHLIIICWDRVLDILCVGHFISWTFYQLDIIFVGQFICWTLFSWTFYVLQWRDTGVPETVGRTGFIPTLDFTLHSMCWTFYLLDILFVGHSIWEIIALIYHCM